ncbi:hypothetical protein BJV78DRAFT_1150494 [Lactifluus subvellereus]|nr:hypothetical protein BJV78DRAFT_1158824 [Lactifluus subvellereus]KAI0247852.1 hypothetical protein BJV78DRAFT_1285217 [Lactifluus subvellereus]KAI0247876.1 hypothetical protein BJV78DRAFT_1156925 [Lactifluus subvellereus]KAI0248005.1 hypothetical protein BJV78DRAFT_1285126 [Lactifluus subvellereus]KAI0249902.1 hypothetical protein BJV78DRAFT_1323995 [Lactifluus subvellereus]
MTFPNDCVMSVLGLCTRWLSGTGTRPPMFSPDRDVWTSGRMEEDEGAAVELRPLHNRPMLRQSRPDCRSAAQVGLIRRGSSSQEYRFGPPTSKPGAAPALTAAAAAQLQVQVPFILHSTLSITDHGGAFELTFIPRANALDDFAVELYLGAGASSATCSQVTGGSEWTYVPARCTLR